MQLHLGGTNTVNTVRIRLRQEIVTSPRHPHPIVKCVGLVHERSCYEGNNHDKPIVLNQTFLVACYVFCAQTHVCRKHIKWIFRSRVSDICCQYIFARCNRIRIKLQTFSTSMDFPVARSVRHRNCSAICFPAKHYLHDDKSRRYLPYFQRQCQFVAT